MGPGSGRRPSGVVKDTLNKLGDRYPNGSFVKPVSGQRIRDAIARNMSKAGHSVLEKGKYPNGTHYVRVKSNTGSTSEWNIANGSVYRQG